MVHPWAKYDKNPPTGSWDFVLTRFSYGRTTRKHNASGALRVGDIKIWAALNAISVFDKIV